MALNLENIFWSIGIRNGNTQSISQYDFYYGVEWSDSTFTYNQYDFFKKAGFDSRYNFFTTYAESERAFYENVDDSNIYNFKTFYENAGAYLGLTSGGGGATPSVSFTVDDLTLGINQVATFTDTSTNTPTAWSWGFGDGVGTSTLQNPTYSYSSIGSYIITLTASNAFGTASGTSSVTVGLGPTSSFTIDDTTLLPGQVMTLTDTSTESPNAWSYDFGDGNSSSLQNPTHSYTSVGNYIITLTASNDFSSGTGYTASIEVGLAPTASFTSSTQSTTTGEVITFTDTSTNTPTSWLWDFNDGVTSSVQNPTHSYSATGSFIVSMTASNDFGQDYFTSSIDVSSPISASFSFDATPDSSFTSSTQSTAPDTVITFTDTSNNEPNAWSWDFGDGATSSLQSPTHSYSATGSYIVGLTASNTEGEGTFATASIEVVQDIDTPLDIFGSDLEVWVNTEDSNITLDGSSRVSQIDDLSGNNNHFVSATASERPVVKSSGLNGKDVLYFDTTYRKLEVSSRSASYWDFINLTGEDAYVLIIMKSLSNNDDSLVFTLGTTDINNEGGFYFALDDRVANSRDEVGFIQLRNGCPLYNGDTGYPSLTILSSDNQFPISSWSIMSAEMTDSGSDRQVTLYNNVDNSLGTGTDAVECSTNQTLHINPRSDLSSEMDVAEIIICRCNPTTQQISDLKTYFNDKWGFSL